MCEGEKRKIKIPPSLGFGSEGDLNRKTGKHRVPPNATMIFEMELVKIERPGVKEL